MSLEKKVVASITKETWSKLNPPQGEDTFPKLLKRNYDEWGETQVAYRYKDYGYWRELTWKDFYERTKWLAGGLASLGFGPGDKIAICGENAPEWFRGQTAAQSLGGASVGFIYRFHSCRASISLSTTPMQKL